MKSIRRNFHVNQKVLVSSEGGWKNDFTGTITGGPESVDTRQGEDYYYWVDFDADQFDLSDGPYFKAQILSRYISSTNNKSIYSKLVALLKG